MECRSRAARARRYRRWKRNQMVRLCEAQNWRCCYCGVEVTLDEPRYQPTSATREHVWARGNGGDDSIENKVIACYACNNRRGARSHRKFFKMIQRELASRQATV